jgi:hypothetical protein
MPKDNDTLFEEFEEFHKANPRVYELHLNRRSAGTAYLATSRGPRRARIARW